MATNIALDGNFQFPSTTQPRLSHFSHVRLHASLWTIARQAPLSMEFSRQACWEWVAMPSPREWSQPRDQTQVSYPGRWVLYHWSTREAPHHLSCPTLFDPTSIFNCSVAKSCPTLCDPVDQVPLSSTFSWSLLKFISFESVMLSNYLILCHPHLLLPSVFPSIRVFSNEKVLPTR